jgi:uncharacterized membrane protein YhaH (DUF805 family)
MQSLSQLLVSPAGRIRRRTYYWSFAAVLAVFCIFFTFLEATVNRAVTWILYPPALWAMFVLTSKRLHDREQSAWWLLIVAIPVLGPLLLGAWLFLGRGTRGENRFGPDPRSAGADYLTVSIGR